MKYNTYTMLQKKMEQLETEFVTCLQRLRSSGLYDINNGSCDEDLDMAVEDYWAYEYLRQMYSIICIYLELIGLNDYLATFKERYRAIIADRVKALTFDVVPLQYGDTMEDFQLLIEWETLLKPLGLFRGQEAIQNQNLDKIIKLLECTNEILKTTKTRVTKEEDINATIRTITKLYYTGVTAYSEGYFVHPFKQYRPDIIIREISTAIEYKLIRNDSETGNKLDELLIDAQRYTGNSRNQFCIAVFCLSQHVKKTKKEILEDWENRHFPDNWRLVIISDVQVEDK